jgi:hypothetical protein
VVLIHVLAHGHTECRHWVWPGGLVLSCWDLGVVTVAGAIGRGEEGNQGWVNMQRMSCVQANKPLP